MLDVARCKVPGLLGPCEELCPKTQVVAAKAKAQRVEAAAKKAEADAEAAAESSSSSSASSDAVDDKKEGEDGGDKDEVRAKRMVSTQHD